MKELGRRPVTIWLDEAEIAKLLFGHPWDTPAGRLRTLIWDYFRRRDEIQAAGELVTVTNGPRKKKRGKRRR